MQKDLPWECGLCLWDMRALLGVTVLSSGKHVLVAGGLSLLLEGTSPKKTDSKAEAITLRRLCAVLAVSGQNGWAFLHYRNQYKIAKAASGAGLWLS